MSRRDSFSDSISSRGARLRHTGALLIASLALASCVNLETAVPPVATLAAHGRDAATLEAGRRTYLESCTHCHRAEPVRDHAASRWPGIIEEMAQRSRLTADEQRAVLAYVLAVSRSQ